MLVSSYDSILYYQRAPLFRLFLYALPIFSFIRNLYKAMQTNTLHQTFVNFIPFRPINYLIKQARRTDYQ